MANFAQQRKAAARKASQLGATSDGPTLPRGYSATPTDYTGETGSLRIDIVDSGSKGTIVNKPNGAYSTLEPVDPEDAQTRSLKYKKTGH